MRCTCLYSPCTHLVGYDSKRNDYLLIFSVGTLTHSEQRMDITQSMKAGEWICGCVGLLHPDVGNVSWVTHGASGWFQSMVLIFHVRPGMNHKCFLLQKKLQKTAFFTYEFYDNVNCCISWFPCFCRERWGFGEINRERWQNIMRYSGIQMLAAWNRSSRK